MSIAAYRPKLPDSTRRALMSASKSTTRTPPLATVHSLPEVAGAVIFPEVLKASGGRLVAIQAWQEKLQVPIVVIVPSMETYQLAGAWSKSLSLGALSVFQHAARLRSSLATLVARQCVISIMKSWPVDVHFSSSYFGGPGRLVDISRLLASSEALTQGGRTASMNKPSDDVAHPLLRQPNALNTVGSHFVTIAKAEHRPLRWNGFKFQCVVCSTIQVRNPFPSLLLLFLYSAAWCALPYTASFLCC